jgi:sugar lactone lactonase YvrE
LRRLLVICAVTLIGLAVFAATARKPTVTEAAASQASNDTSSISSPSKVTVVATGVSVRAIAIGLLDSSATLFLTNASAPNQIFQIGLGPSSGAAANARIAAIAGTGAAGSLGDGGAALSAQLDLNERSLAERSAIAVAGDGTLYVADTGNSTIRAIASAASTEPGVIRSVVGRWAMGRGVTLSEPMGIALDRAGDLFIADHAAGTVDMIAVTGAKETLAHVTSPASIAVTLDDATVFVASPETGAVFSIATQTHEIRMVAGFPEPQVVDETGRAVRMQWPSSNTCSTIDNSSQQVCPGGLAVDADGNLFISDPNSGRILRVDARTSATSTIASGLHQPGALAIDTSGNLYAAEQGTNRIVAFAQVGASQGSLSLTPASATYGNEPVGGQTAMQSFTVSNLSSSAITGLNVPITTTPADFTVESNSCTTTLAKNSSCMLSVAFTPTTTGARSDTLTVTDSSSVDSASTVLSGTGDDYQLQLASGQLSSISVQAGAAGTFNLQVVPDSVFSGTVTLICPNNLPTNTTCTFSSPTVNVTAGTAATFSVTFQTTGIINPLTTQMPFIPAVPPNFPRFPALLSIGIAMAFFWLTRGRIRWISTTLVVFAIALVLAACSKGRSAASIGATPAGTSTMAVTGNSQNASRALTITLNVVQK